MFLLHDLEEHRGGCVVIEPPKERISGMRKEVKRSLVVWPSIASAALIGMSSLPIFVQPYFGSITDGYPVLSSAQPEWREPAQPDSAVPPPEPVDLHQETEPPDAGLEIVERVQHGERGMKLPPRLAFVLGVAPDETTIDAPVVDTRRELAGTSMPLPSTDPVAAPETSPKVKNGEIAQLDLAPPDIESIFASKISVADGQESEPKPLNWTSILPDSISTLAKVIPSFNESKEDQSLTLGAPTVNTHESERVAVLDSPSSENANEAEPLVLNASEIDAVVNSLQLSRPTTPAPSINQIEIGIEKADQSTPIVSTDPNIASQRRPEHQESQMPSSVGSPASWPVTSTLNEQLSAFAPDVDRAESASEHLITSSNSSGNLKTPDSFSSKAWARDVSELLRELQSLNRLGDDRAGELINRLESHSRLAIDQAERLEDHEARVKWLCAAFAVSRRTAVWNPVWEVARSSNRQEQSVRQGQSDVADIMNLVEAVESELDQTGDTTGWKTFLMLDEIAKSVDTIDSTERSLVAQRFLSRLQWHSLDEKHAKWLDRDSIRRLTAAVRPWTTTAIDYADLLSQIERQESDSVEPSAAEIAAAVQTLRFADQEKLTTIAKAIETHYRNANLRVAISAEMIGRLLPAIQPKSVPIRTSVLGSRVRGTSRVESDLELVLHPSADRWSMSLKTLGNVDTQSVGYKGPVAVTTSGHSRFVAATPIDVTSNGIDIGDPNVFVHGNTNLRGIQSKYDRWPLLRGFVRNVATSRYESIAPRSNQIANQKMRLQIAETIDQTIESKIAEATGKLGQAVLGPLGRLELDPKVIDMQTTNKRLLARYRLAGDWQLAAFTPRPRAPRDSLMSVQIHQSAINNTLEQLVPSGEEKSVEDTISEALQVLGAKDTELPEDLPDDVTIQFSKTRPISVEIDDGQLWVTMRIVRLRRGDRMKLSKFIVRAAYKAQVEGMDVQLVRDGHLRISGSGMSMRERLPVRAIFNKVLSPNRSFPLTLPQLRDHEAVDGLAITQLEMRDGWIGLAVGKEDAPRMALAAQSSPASSQR